MGYAHNEKIEPTDIDKEKCTVTKNENGKKVIKAYHKKEKSIYLQYFENQMELKNESQLDFSIFEDRKPFSFHGRSLLHQVRNDRCLRSIRWVFLILANLRIISFICILFYKITMATFGVITIIYLFPCFVVILVTIIITLFLSL